MRSQALCTGVVSSVLAVSGISFSSYAFAAVQNISTLVKCTGSKKLCFEAIVRAQTVADSVNHYLFEVELIMLWGPGYTIPGWGFEGAYGFDDRRGAFPRDAYYYGAGNFCATGGTHNHRSAHRRMHINQNTYEQIKVAQEHIAGNPCGDIP